MGSQLAVGPSAWRREMLGAYARLIGCGDCAVVDDLPTELGFEAACREIARRHGLRSPESLDLPECRIEWSGGAADGKAIGGVHVSTFEPDTPEWAAPPPGTELRVRFPGGSHRAIALRSEGGRLLLTRAPNRLERRAHRRTPVRGFALVRLGGEERTSELRDISEGGIGIAGPFLIEAGQHLEVLLRLEGKRSLGFECEGQVANCRMPCRGEAESYQMGVAFTRLPAALRDRIRQIVRQEAEPQP